MQAGESFDKLCDAQYENLVEADCTPGGTDCAAYNTASVTFCCFKPKTSSNCYFDYIGTPQCVAK